jgi:hypothetical protein
LSGRCFSILNQSEKTGKQLVFKSLNCPLNQAALFDETPSFFVGRGGRPGRA